MKTIAWIQILWACGDGRHQAVQQRSHHELVAGLAGRNLVPERAVRPYGGVLKDVDHVGDLPLLVTPRLQRLEEVAAAAAMVFDALIEPVAARVCVWARPGVSW